MTALDDPTMIKIYSLDDGFSCIARKDATPPKLTGGFGGWTVINRPKRTGLTRWVGKDPLRLDVALLFDGWAHGVTQEVQISNLINMAMHNDTKDRKPPPRLKIQGLGLPRSDVDDMVWVIENLDFGNNTIWDVSNSKRVRMRQDVVVHFLQYVAEDRVPGSSGSNTGVGAGKSSPTTGRPKTVKVKKGDTLGALAVKYYHNRNVWGTIATANNIRDPKSLKVGQTLRLP